MRATDFQRPGATAARHTVVTDSDYREAERAVDWLSDQGFAVEHVAIVGTDLHYIEQIGGRVTTGRATLIGAGQGAWVGLFVGLLFGLFFNGAAFLGVLLYTIVAGIVFGAAWGAAIHVMQRGRRDFASIAGTSADRYEVQVDEGQAVEAERLLATMPSRPNLTAA